MANENKALNKSKNVLDKARAAKKDEFYTRLEDIEHELWHYGDYFKDATILCNCDDPFESNFFKYFAMNLKHFGIKKLVATCYDGSPVVGDELVLFRDDEPGRHPYKVELTSVPDMDGDGAVDITDVEAFLRSNKAPIKELKGNGDFRSKECIELLKEADIVVTNPPFSLFREYVAQLFEYDKKFIIIGNQNAITYKDIFSLFREDKMWLGYKCGDMAFRVPQSYPPRSTRFWIDDDGQKWRSMGNICWYTNIDIKKRHEFMDLYKPYEENEYEQYDNYDAINVNRTADIPIDYDGVMGVPITFMDKYNPQQFQIVGLIAGNIKGLAGIESTTGKDGPYVNGKLKFGRILIRRKQG